MRIQAEGLTDLIASSVTDDSTLAIATANAPASELIPQPLLSAVARLSARGAVRGEAPAVSVPLNANAVTFTLHEHGVSSRQVTPYGTVGDSLAGAGVALGPMDRVTPPPDAKLTAGMHVHIAHARSVNVVYGTEEMRIETQAVTIGELFDEQALDVQDSDFVFPAPDSAVRGEMTVWVMLKRTNLVRETDEHVPYGSVTQYDYTLPVGQKVVQQAGVDGANQKTYEVVTVNGIEISRKLVSEERIEPTNEVVLLGAQAVDIPIIQNGGPPPGEGECRERMVVWATYYTEASAGGTVTRTGTGVYKGIIATDPNVIPLGTRMYVPGYGYGIAADTGGGVIGAHIDLAYGNHDVYDWGSRTLEICILG